MDKHQKITERTLYPFIGKSLDEIGFKSIQEISAGKGYIDLECFYNSLRLIIEVKIEDPHTKWKNLLEGVAQAWKYSKSTNAVGSIVIEYPTDVRRPLLFTPEVIEEIANQSNVKVFVLTDFWTKKIDKITPIELFRELKEKTDAFIIRKEKYVSLDLAVDTIREAILTISGVLRQSIGTIDDLINIVVGRFDLFLSLAEENEEKLRLAAIDLSSYLLVNQILFYHIYASLTKKIDDLDETKINSVFDLKEYFKKITDVNYKAIYSVDVVSELPDIDLIIGNVKNVIRAIKGVRASSIRHDLIGRIYHESLPFETRKRLATFYTKPVAAEILAGLCIDKWDKKIIDIACGSGTLLVAAYRRKEVLYKEYQEREELPIGDIEKLHNLFVKEQITGLDIMPFACHLTAVNLSAQNPHVTTNKLRVAVQDSLSLQNAVKSKEFKEQGIILKPFSRTIQETLLKPEIIKQTYFSRNGEVVEAKGVVSPEGIGEEFLLYPSEVVIMNPPFSDREKMPEDYRKKLKTFDKLIAKCGNQVNLWGFFLALADDLIIGGGKIGAVIPINIARGEATQKIRNHILENYRISYIVKATKDLGFSEAAAFRDILLIAEKGKPKDDYLTAIVYLKKSIKNINLDAAEKIVERIKRIRPKGDNIYSNDDFEMYFVSYEDIFMNKTNLMPLIWGRDINSTIVFKRFFELVRKKAEGKITKIKKEWLMEGFHSSPKGMSELVYITRPTDKSRTTRAFLVLDKEDQDNVYFKLAKVDLRFKIKKTKVTPAMRTLAGVRRLNLSINHDYIFCEEFDGFDRLLMLSKWKEKKQFGWSVVKKEIAKKNTFLAISYRFNPYSKNTSLLAISSEFEFVPSDGTFKVWKVKNESDAKILSLNINSIHYLTQFFTSKQETTGQLSTIRSTDLVAFSIFDVDKLSSNEKQTLLNLFEKIKDVDFPSIADQLETKFWARVELDKTVLKILGFSDEEIDEWLPKVYDALVDELKAMKEVK